jgi:hypothetical protein
VLIKKRLFLDEHDQPLAKTRGLAESDLPFSGNRLWIHQSRCIIHAIRLFRSRDRIGVSQCLEGTQVSVSGVILYPNQWVRIKIGHGFSPFNQFLSRAMISRRRYSNVIRPAKEATNATDHDISEI